jgi:excinuclease UvrABC nuclease subunit
MEKEKLAKIKLPDTPGVYFFLGARKEILYIGKATSLNNRVKSYFSTDIKEKRSALIEKMVTEAKTVEVTQTDSVLEALILECNLIRTHKPKYNSISKDDKSYNHLVITNEPFPRVLVVRGKDLTTRFQENDIKYHFGPFTSGTLFKEALKIVRRLFRFYDTKTPVDRAQSKLTRGIIDFNKQIGLFPDETNKQEYAKTIRYVRMFFEGKKKLIIRELEKEMMRLAKKEAFEDAAILKRKIFALQHIQDIALLKDDARRYTDERSARIEAYDVAHLFGDDMVGVMTVVEAGEAKHGEYRKFTIKSIQGSNDTGALKEVLSRRLQHPEWPYPQIIVVDGSTAQKNAAEYILRKLGIMIPIVAVVKDDKHRPVRIIAPKKLLELYENAILLCNAEAHRFALGFHKKKRTARALS